MKVVYVIGSLRNPKVPEIAAKLRVAGYDAFDDWYAAGPEADDKWQEYEVANGKRFQEALYGHHAKCVYEFDRSHLDRADAVVLVMPAGKSGHLELGYSIGKGKPGFVLMDKEPERFDVMYRFCTNVVNSFDSLLKALGENL